MSYIEGVAREQQVLLPEVLDEYVTAENPIRFICADSSFRQYSTHVAEGPAHLLDVRSTAIPRQGRTRYTAGLRSHEASY